MTTDDPGRRGALIARVAGAQQEILLSDSGESVWLEVIRKMDEVYADLLGYETELETRNGELEQARGFISSVLASMSDILVVCDANERILQINAAFVTLLGAPQETLLGSALCDHVAPADRERAGAVLRAGLAGETVGAEVRFLTTQGPSDLVAIHCSALFAAERRRAGAVLTGRPIGELRRAYEALHHAHTELQQAQTRLIEQEKLASLGRLVAGVAHELNNPISFVYGNIHTLDRYRKNLESYLAAIHAGADAAPLRRTLKIDALLADLAPLIEGTLEGAVRIADIVKNLRRLSFGADAPKGAVDIARLVGTAAQWAARSKKSRATPRLDIEPGLLARGHDGQLHSVMVNLVDNALDAVRTVEDPVVRITARRSGETIVITVADNGPGVRASDRGRVFEPFFTTKPVGEGAGLGLWISYSILREHGGALELGESETGASFVVSLPVFDAPEG